MSTNNNQYYIPYNNINNNQNSYWQTSPERTYYMNNNVNNYNENYNYTDDSSSYSYTYQTPQRGGGKKKGKRK